MQNYESYALTLVLLGSTLVLPLLVHLQEDLG